MDTVMETRPSRTLTRRIALLAMLFTAPVFILFICLGKIDEGIGVWICAGIVAGSIIVWWDWRKSLWFWAAIVIAALIQIPFILLVPWADRYMSFVSLLPFGILDYAIIYGCVKLAENREKRSGDLS